MIFLKYWTFYNTDPTFTAFNSRVLFYFFSPITFFFILSGWSLTHGYYEKIKNNHFDVMVYLKKRILRLYPVHLITFFLMLPLITYWSGAIPKEITVANLLLIHAFFPSDLSLFSYKLSPGVYVFICSGMFFSLLLCML